MNPSFPVQRPPSALANHVPQLSNDLHQPVIAQHDPTSQWAALNTNPGLQRTLCKAAANGQLNQDQMASFSSYMKGNAAAFKMYQLELQAAQQQQVQQHHQQQQQQQQQQAHQVLEPDKLSAQHVHQLTNGTNGFISSPLSNTQLAMQLQQVNHHYQALQPSAPPQQSQHTRLGETFPMISGDLQLTQSIAQFRQVQETLKNPALSSAERETATMRARELRDILATRMSQLGMRRDGGVGSPGSTSSAPTPQSQVFQSPGPSGQPQHPNDVQRAHLSVAYQRQQQMMSNMPLTPQPAGGIARPLSRNLVPTSAASPRPTLLSGRNSPSPNAGNVNSNNMMQSISRPGSSHQSMLGSASSPPAIHNAASPPNNSGADLRRAVATRPGSAMKNGASIGTPPTNASSPLAHSINPAPSPRPASAASMNPSHGQSQGGGNLSGNLGQQMMSPPAGHMPSPVTQPREPSIQAPASQTVAPSEPTTRVTPPTQVFSGSTQGLKPLLPNGGLATPQSQQYSAIAAQQQQASSTQPTPTPPTATTPALNTASAPVRDVNPPRVTSPAPTPFPPPRPTLTSGHATSSTLAGTVLHRPPVNGIHEALGQSSSSNDAGGRGQESTSSSRILSKRKIQELVESIDPSERLEAEVEDVSAIFPLPLFIKAVGRLYMSRLLSPSRWSSKSSFFCMYVFCERRSVGCRMESALIGIGGRVHRFGHSVLLSIS
ncbi:hypothetical protein CROQUDRAFT_668211 [Cronartium quercuum f. sp. fusiforme G11]|uniref:Uncharacterized protein n=1 Tax=Cronartium quercuum f. sp. fusiforme G11 TaxID=708437 RepID=A0A9P6NRG0_9BASI|nr:hypothetical protein CROQUDRAFT_668211 [Cronartium quercuum f. sp. fusiforme G11]